VELGAANRAELFLCHWGATCGETIVTRPPAWRHRAETSRLQIHPHHSPWWPVGNSDEGVTEMTSAGVSDVHEIRELTIDELDQGRRRTVDGR